MTNYLILLPTSETKTRGGDETKPYRIVKNNKKYNYFISLELERDYIYSKLREAINEQSEEELENTFQLKGKNLQEAIELISDLLNEETMPAVERFNGVMFNSIKYSLMNQKQKNNFNESVIFLDSLFGLLKPLDLIPEYKLKIDSTFLDINTIKFWKDKLKSYFEYLFKEKLVISILPQTHQKILSNHLNLNFVNISFCELKNGKIINTGHNSKQLKGELINYLVTKEFLTREDLFNFKHSNGYEYSKENSNENEILYLRKV